MQQVKYFMRAFGTPSVVDNIRSSVEVEDELNYGYLAQGWRIESTHYLGGQKTTEGMELGYRVLHVLVKEDKEDKGDEETLDEAIGSPVRRGRPRKPVEVVPA